MACEEIFKIGVNSLFHEGYFPTDWFKKHHYENYSMIVIQTVMKSSSGIHFRFWLFDYLQKIDPASPYHDMSKIVT